MRTSAWQITFILKIILTLLLNSVKSQLQLIKHVLANHSKQLSIKQARLPLGSKNTSVQIRQLHKKNPLLTSGFPPPPPLGIQ